MALLNKPTTPASVAAPLSDAEKEKNRRMVYLNIRIPEMRDEILKLTAERKKLSAERKGVAAAKTNKA